LNFPALGVCRKEETERLIVLTTKPYLVLYEQEKYLKVPVRAKICQYYGRSRFLCFLSKDLDNRKTTKRRIFSSVTDLQKKGYERILVWFSNDFLELSQLVMFNKQIGLLHTIAIAVFWPSLLAGERNHNVHAPTGGKTS
jgi:hypothetical protein